MIIYLIIIYNNEFHFLIEVYILLVCEQSTTSLTVLDFWNLPPKDQYVLDCQC